MKIVKKVFISIVFTIVFVIFSVIITFASAQLNFSLANSYSGTTYDYNSNGDSADVYVFYYKGNVLLPDSIWGSWSISLAYPQPTNYTRHSRIYMQSSDGSSEFLTDYLNNIGMFPTLYGKLWHSTVSASVYTGATYSNGYRIVEVTVIGS